MNSKALLILLITIFIIIFLSVFIAVLVEFFKPPKSPTAKSVGSVCTVSSECDSGGICDSGICKSNIKGPCNLPEQCFGSNVTCASAKCVDISLGTLGQKPNGTVCVSDLVNFGGICLIGDGSQSICTLGTDCISGTCNNGKCVDRGVIGKPCGSAVDVPKNCIPGLSCVSYSSLGSICNLSTTAGSFCDATFVCPVNFTCSESKCAAAQKSIFTEECSISNPTISGMFCPQTNNVALFQKNTATSMNNISLKSPATGYLSTCNWDANLCPPDSSCQSGICVMQGTCYKNTITTTGSVCSIGNNTTWRIFKFTGQKWDVITTNDFLLPLLSRFDLVKDPSSGNLNFSASLSVGTLENGNVSSDLFTFDGSNWKTKNITYSSRSFNLIQAVSGLSFFNGGVGIYSVTQWNSNPDNFMYIGPQDTAVFDNLHSTFESGSMLTTTGVPFTAKQGCSTPQNFNLPDVVSINIGDFHSTSNSGNNFLAYVSTEQGKFGAGLCTVQVTPNLVGGTLSSNISVLVDSFTDGSNYLQSFQTQAIPTSAIQYWAGGSNGIENRWDLAILNVFQGPTIASGKDSLGQNIADFGSFAFVRFYATGKVGISNTSSNSDDGAALFSLQLPKTGRGEVFEGYLLDPPKIQSNGFPETTISQSMKMAVHYDPTSIRFKVAILCPVSFDTVEQQYRVIFWDSSLVSDFFITGKPASLGNINSGISTTTPGVVVGNFKNIWLQMPGYFYKPFIRYSPDGELFVLSQ